MAFICFNCGKKSVKGTQHRHKPGVAGRKHLRRAPRTPKTFAPNLHTAFLIEKGYSKKVKLCTTCRRMLKKEGRIKVWKKEDIKKSVPAVKAEMMPAVIKIDPVKIAKKEEKPKKVKTGKAVVKKVTKKSETTAKKKETKTPEISIEDIVGKKG